MAQRQRFVVAGTPSDSHTWNLVFLQLLLEERGHQVVNVGSCASAELVAEACRRERPDAVLVSSVNGHGFQDGLRLAEAWRDAPALDGVRLIIGGKLNTSDSGASEMESALLSAGFDHVFQGETAVARFGALLDRLERPAAPPGRAAPLFAPMPLARAAA